MGRFFYIQRKNTKHAYLATIVAMFDHEIKHSWNFCRNKLLKKPLNKSWLSRQVPKTVKYKAQSFRSCSLSLPASMQAKRREYRKYFQVLRPEDCRSAI
jgi:hypothetical protein